MLELAYQGSSSRLGTAARIIHRDVRVFVSVCICTVFRKMRLVYYTDSALTAECVIEKIHSFMSRNTFMDS